MAYNPNQPRDPGGKDGGKWVSPGEGIDDPKPPRRKWDPPSLGADGKYHVYHGTTLEKAVKIKSTALETPSGTGLGYLMLTSSKDQAAQYAQGYEGKHVVMHYALSPDDANKWLSRPEEHDVYGQKAYGHSLRAGKLPGKFLVAVEPATQQMSGAKVYPK